MIKQASRALALATVAAIAFAGPALAQGAAGAPAGVTYSLERDVTSNRIATALMYGELTDAANALRAKVAAQDWTAAQTGVGAVRARIDAIKASAVVDQKARLLIAELRPHAVSIERDLMARKAVSVRTVDMLIAQIERINGELLQAGLMERMGGGAGRGTIPRLPEVRIYPPGTNIDAIPAPVLVVPAAPVENKNQIEDWRGDDQD